MGESGAHVDSGQLIGVDHGEPLDFAGVRGRLKITGADSEQRFAVAYFPAIPPHVLAAPLHRHHNEDEYSCVLEGTLSVQLHDKVVSAEEGEWVVKPRGQWHTFWNGTDRPCRTIEIVSPAGFERYFRDVRSIGNDMTRLAQINSRYGLDMDVDSVPALCQRFGLSFVSLAS